MNRKAFAQTRVATSKNKSKTKTKSPKKSLIQLQTARIMEPEFQQVMVKQKRIYL